MEKKLALRDQFGSKAFVKEPEVGKWFKFDVTSVGAARVGYGKIVAIIDDETVEVEKYFEKASYRPFDAPAWYDNLPFAVVK